ncbi:MAG: T9SS type B sorting domain-containing protein [Bacteroidota bacterium]
MKILYKIFLVVLLGINFGSKACSPLNVPTLVSQAVVNNSLILNWQTNTTYVNCQNACCANPFLGVVYATFTTTAFAATVSPMAYPTQSLSILGWCPGCYKFRARERNSGMTSSSLWTPTYTFSIPGFLNPPQVSLSSSNLNICPPQSTTLTANVLVDCGLQPYTYTWSGPGLSCITCSNPVVSPTVTTTYTAVVTGGQLSCWSQTATITVYIGPIPPVIGPASAYPPSVCSGSTTIVGLAFYNGNIQWQSSSTANGPWTNVPNGNGYNFTSPTLTTSVFYRALVAGCLTIDSSNVVAVAVNPNPTVTVPSVLICPAQTATLNGSGAASYFWSFGAFPTGPNTGGAAPMTTTNYTVTGITSGCTGTTVVTVSVGATPLVAVSDQTICFNQNMNLTANGGFSYDWSGPLGFASNIQSPVIPNAVTSMSGQYSVTVTSAVGCTNTGISNITVLSIITPTIHTSDPICFGGPLSFTAAGASTYSWSGPNAFSTLNPYPVRNNLTYADGGIYTLLGAIGSCTGSTNMFILVKTPPNATAYNSSPVCHGFPVTFSATGGVTYTWTGPSGFFTSNPNHVIPIMYLNNAGGYTLAATGTNNCVSRIVSNVTVNPLPIIPVINLTVCLYSPVNLTSGGGSIYSWSGPHGFNSGFQNPTIPVASFSLTGQYSVAVTSTAGCSNTAATSVVIIGVPSPTINAPLSICEGSTLSLSGLGGNAYLWTGPNSFTSNLQNPKINNIGLLGSGDYTLKVTGGICSTTITKSITVLPLPIVTIGTNSVCETKALQLTASGGATYEWYTPAGVYAQQPTFTIPYAAPSHSGTYSVVVTSSNSCVTATTFPVIVYPNPTVVASGATVCAGEPAIIKSNGGVLYSWTGPGFSSSNANATIPVVNHNTIGTYIITITGVNTCTSATGVNVALIALPQPSIIVTPTVCFNTEVRLEASGGLYYKWDGPFDFVSTLQNTTFTASSMGLSGTYTLSAFNGSGCVGYATTSVTVLPMPEGLLVSDNQKHCVPFCSEYSFNNKYGIPVTSAVWQINNQTYHTPTFRYCFYEPGEYRVSGTFGDENGCANTSTFMIVTHETPRADFLFYPQQPVETVDEVLFKNNSQGNNIVKYSWSFINNYGYKSEEENTEYYFREAGSYPVSLVVKNIWGCADTVVKSIIVEEDFMLFVPNAFTPNDDGHNEFFFPKGRGIVDYHLLIHDRWGEKVFETRDFYEGWDGSFRGKPCKTEVYQWKIIARDKNGKIKDLWGHVTLYR